MWYFAYGSNLNSRAVAECCRHYGDRPPPLKSVKHAVLDNYRLGFPIYSEYWGGGIADIVYDPGKYVMGVLFDLSDAEIAVLDQKVGRKLDSHGKEMGVYGRIEVKVSPLGKGEPVKAATYHGIGVDRYHIPPTQHYMDLVIQARYDLWPVDDVDFVSSEFQHAGRPQAEGIARPRRCRSAFVIVMNFNRRFTAK